jgi:membrane protease YdiL (CAAX protease family)
MKPWAFVSGDPAMNADPGSPTFPWRYAAGLMLASAVATVLTIPYDTERDARNREPAVRVVWKPSEFAVLIESEPNTEYRGLVYVVLVVVAGSILAFPAILLGLKLGRPLGLAWPPIAGWDAGPDRFRRMGSTLLLASALGAASVFVILPVAQVLSFGGGDSASVVEPPWWAGLLGSFGAGILEEILLRLGAMTVIAWLLMKLSRRRLQGAPLMWTAIVLASLLFGMMHLPVLAQTVGLTGRGIAFVMIGNGGLGLLFGWLYWRKGLLAAMAGHTAQDLLLHVVLPLLST